MWNLLAVNTVTLRETMSMRVAARIGGFVSNLELSVALGDSHDESGTVLG